MTNVPAASSDTTDQCALRPEASPTELWDAFTKISTVFSAFMRHHAFGPTTSLFPNHPPPKVLGLLRKFHRRLYELSVHARVAAPAAGADPRPRSAGEALAFGRKYFPFAEAAYAEAPLDDVGGLPVKLWFNQEKPFGSPLFFLAEDEAEALFVLAVRGTSSVVDALTDLLADTTPFGGGEGVAHQGVCRAATALLDEVRPALQEEFQRCPQYGLVITGHSLGAGVVCLLTKMILDEGGYGRGIRSAAFAPPPVLYPMEIVDEEWSNALECFVHGDDIIPTVSLFGLYHLLRHIDHLDSLDSISPEDKVTLKDLLPAEAATDRDAASDSNVVRAATTDASVGQYLAMDSATAEDEGKSTSSLTDLEAAEEVTLLSLVAKFGHQFLGERPSTPVKRDVLPVTVAASDVGPDEESPDFDLHALVIPAPRGVRWLVDAVIHDAGHDDDDRGGETGGEEAETIDLGPDSLEQEEAGDYSNIEKYAMQTRPARTICPKVYFTSNCVAAHSTDGYKHALAKAVVCARCDDHLD